MRSTLAIRLRPWTQQPQETGAVRVAPASAVPRAESRPPIWLLDVDGVLNAVNVLAALDGVEWADYTQGSATDIHTYNIVWSPSLVQRICRLHDDELVEVRWLTTWCDRAKSEIAPLLKLPNLEVIDRPHQGQGWWKLPLAQQVAGAEPGRAIIWTDDDLGSDRSAMQWIETEHGKTGRRILAVTPTWKTGISRPQMDAIEAFARQVTGR